MDSGIVSLKRLYDYAKEKHDENPSECKSMAPRRFDEGRAFGEETKNLLLNIPDNVPGFFLLGKFSNNGEWLGMNICRSAQVGKYAIEKIKKRRAFIFRCFYGCDELKRACMDYFPEKCNDYWKEWQKAFSYAGSTYLIWFTLPGFKPGETMALKRELATMGIAEGIIREDLIEPKTQGGRAMLKFKEALNNLNPEDRVEPDYIRNSDYSCE